MEIGAKLRKLRESKGLRLADVAQRANMTIVQVSRLELGTRNLDVSDFVTLCGALSVLPGDLLPHSGQAAPHLKAVEPLADDLQRLPEPQREAMMHSFRVQVSTLAPFLQSNVVQFPAQPEPVEHAELSDDAMDRLVSVMQQAGLAQPRKAARGPEYSVGFYGLASAGEGIELLDDVPEEYRQIPQYYFRKGARGVLKVEGESMMDVGIFSGDLLFIKPTPEPHSGDLVVCTLNRRVYVKQLKRGPNGQPVQLVSKNKDYPPIEIGSDDTLTFYGVVVGRTGDL